MSPLNLDLISPSKEDVKYLGQVKSLASLNNSKTDFQSDGLYGVEIFSVSGSEDRNIRFGYIDIRLDIIHPKLYDAITALSSVYLKILEGKILVKFDSKEKDFVIDEDGDTGYQFFLKHLPKIDFKRNTSERRDLKINMIYKYIKENKLTYNKLLVMPAGIREYEVSKDGRGSEDEINDLYRSVIRDTDLVSNLDVTDDELKIIDPVRIKLQKDINEVYEYIKVLIDGKHKFIRGSWVKRGVDYGTRNIFSGLPITVTSLSDTENVTKPYETVVGVLQATKAFLPLVYYKINSIFLNDILSVTGKTANLVDHKTLKQVTIELSKTELDKWSKQDGIDSIVNRTIDDEVKNTPIVIEGHYLKLIFDNGKEIKLINDIDLEEGIDLKSVRPITYGEFLFLSMIDILEEYPATIARHPIIKEGSTFYTFLKLYSTIDSRTVYDKNNEKKLFNYPIIGRKWINTIGLHYSRLSSLDAD